LDFNEVIKLAKTKWNFLNFKPGLVGGHCLPVDPYYFASIAKKYNQNVKVTLAGRSINNSMVGFISKLIINDIKNIKVQKNIKILIAGLTYKPDVPDLRNSLAIDIFKLIKKNNKNTDGFDPIINNKSRIKMKLEKDIKISKYDRIYVLTEHNVFKKKTLIKNKKIVYVFKDL
jgi:nucleotide sugar dehydrogenase